MADATEADCTALRPLALALEKVYKPGALQIKKTELMEGVGDAPGVRSRRREDIVDWPRRVPCNLEYCEHPLLGYCWVVALLERRQWLGMGWGYEAWMGTCGPKQPMGNCNLGGM